MTDGLPPLPPEAQRLLDVERGHRPPPAGERAAVLARVLRTVGAPPGPGGGGGTPAAPVGSALSRLARAASIAAALGVAAVGARTLRRPHAPAVAVARAPSPSREARVWAPATPSAPSVTPSVTPAAVEVVDAVSGAAPHAGDAAASAHHDGDRADDDLVAQVTLVDAARAALDRHEPDEALRVVRRYRRMPGRRLDDEIDVCEVRAYVARGDRGSAERAVARFHRVHPRSVLGAVVDEAWSAMR